VQFNSRTPPGHPEGYLEAANLYKISFDIICKIRRKEPTEQMLDPTVEDGVRMAFIENVIASGKSDQNGLSLKFKI
jgi:hypothetical protein